GPARRCVQRGAVRRRAPTTSRVTATPTSSAATASRTRRRTFGPPPGQGCFLLPHCLGGRVEDLLGDVRGGLGEPVVGGGEDGRAASRTYLLRNASVCG